MKILKRMNKSNNRKNSGFTLVELVIVMAIMGMDPALGWPELRMACVARYPSITGICTSIRIKS